MVFLLHTAELAVDDACGEGIPLTECFSSKTTRRVTTPTPWT
jgi:hypothetical protein